MKRLAGVAGILAVIGCVQALAGHRGQVRFGEVPVPGAVVLAIQGDKSLRAVTDPAGSYSFPEMTDGAWTIQVDMPGFESVRRGLAVVQDAGITLWDLKMLPLEGIKGEPARRFPSETSAAGPVLQVSPGTSEAAERLLINGSVSNGASTPFALPPAFGNNRRGFRSPYTGNVLVGGNSSLFDARSFSLTGQNTAKPGYNRLQGLITVGGPLQIPGVFRMGSFTVSYNRTQNRNASLQTVRVPTAAERRGDLSHSVTAIVDPVSGVPFGGNMIPADLISPQAKALMNLYPQPNFTGGRYNYQVPLVGVTHGDNVQGAINNLAFNNGTNRFSGTVGFQSTRTDNPDLFGFVDRNQTESLSAGVTWVRRLTQRVSATIRYQFNRTVGEGTPYFANRSNISGEAGIAGNDQDPRNWGPPALTFSGGIASLSTGSYSFDRNQSNGIAYTSAWVRGRHGFNYGADFRRQQFNLYSQRDARGSFAFTGAATGNDFADFLLSIPAASSIAFGNPDKYFRQSYINGFLSDDWRLNASVTLNLGVRWEYESPIVERYGRLVNLDIARDFTSAVPVVAGSSHESLVRPDRSGVQPRAGLAWRPRPASSLVVRAGYGLYRDTSVYRAIADQMAQQAPLSKSLSVQNSPEHPLTLADGFSGSPSVPATTFAVDPDFRVGVAHNWTLSIQQDLPAAMQMVATYLGIKGTHVPQRILPNTLPAGAANPCPLCPAGFVYLISSGNSNRHAGTIELRRRQQNGFQAGMQYTYSKAIDDTGLGGYHIVQDWENPAGERGPSNFDQRHQVTAQLQYTTGMLAGIGTLWDGWRGKLLKEWTISMQLTAGSGLPLTPVIFAPVSGTGMTGSLRPDRTGLPIRSEGSDSFLNQTAFAAPRNGMWGNAGRNSITGPSQFGLNASLTRTFRINERVSMDLRVDSTNVLNHVSFPNWNTTINSAQFGLPSRANAMRTVQPSLRVRF